MTIVVAIYSQFNSWCIPQSDVDDLRRAFPEHDFTRADSDAETLERIVEAEVAFSPRITLPHLAAARRLRWIHSPAAGVGNMLFPQMVASPVVLSNSRGNSAGTIAEHVVAVTLTLLRRLPLAWRRQQERAWAQDEFEAGASIRLLKHSRVLVVGVGAIGGETARLLSGFGAHVVGVRRRPEGGSLPGLAAVVASSRLHDELPLADVVVLAAPETSETVHLIGERELSLMKRDSVLVNISRGTLIDEPALVRALEDGRLRGAALDVFEGEPLSPDSPLWSRDDVLITPHVSGFHARYWADAGRLFADNLRRFVAGQPLANPVDKAAGY